MSYLRAIKIAKDILFNNANRIYNLGLQAPDIDLYE